MSTNGTPMQRMRDRGRRAVPAERVAALQERRVEAAVEVVAVVETAVAAVEVSVASQGAVLDTTVADLATAQEQIEFLMTP